MYGFKPGSIKPIARLPSPASSARQAAWLAAGKEALCQVQKMTYEEQRERSRRPVQRRTREEVCGAVL
jgi:hypothetical protein